MTVLEEDRLDSPREQGTLQKEQAYILQQLGVGEEESDSAISGSEDCITSSDEVGQYALKHTKSWKSQPVISADGGYASSSDEDKSEELPIKSANFAINLNEISGPLKSDVTKLSNHPKNIQKMLEGLGIGLPNSYKVPIDNKPAWLDMKKFKIGQKFAQDNYFGLNFSEMLALIFLFSIPDGIYPLIYTEKSGTPFSAFRRYLSTALRVQSWFDHDVWNEESLAYKNLRAVRVMHLNVSKRMNSSAHYSELKDQLTVRGPSNDKPVWSTLKDTIQEDLQSGCPFYKFQKSITDERVNIFFNQFSMSLTQFGFIGFMITYPEKFGAADATDEELDGFIHLWRGLGYLLGIEDSFNFCNGSLQEVRQRCEYFIENIVKTNFINLSEDWEHMSRCMVEGISYYTPALNFESSLLYLCWVLNIPIPRTTATLTWWDTFMFQLIKITLCFSFRLPGIRALHNRLVRRSLVKASSFSAETLKKLQSKTYDFEKEAKFNTRL